MSERLPQNIVLFSMPPLLFHLKRINTIFIFKISIAFQKADAKKKIDLVIKDEVTVVDVDFDWIVVNDQVQSLCCVIYSKFLLEKLIPIKDELGKFNNKLIY